MRTSKLLFIIFLFSASAFAALIPFEIPQALSSENLVARKLVDVDLLKYHEAEIKAALKAAPKLKKHFFAVKLMKEKNAALLNELGKTPPTEEGISYATANEILKSIGTHPVVSFEAARKYDTKTQQVGFCFGRAAYVHWELLRRGVKPALIGKLFAVGGLVYQEARWDFHVATMVRAKEGGWYVIDALQDVPLNPNDWSKKIEQFAHAEDSDLLRFYWTDANKFLLTPGSYSEENLNLPFFNGFFTDLRLWFAKEKN